MVRDGQLRPYLEHLRQLPFVNTVKVTSIDAGVRDSIVDAHLEVVTPSSRFQLVAEIKQTHLSRDLANHFVRVARELPGLVIFAPTIGRNIGDFFANERVNFVDLAGNCHIRLSDQYIARVQGIAPKPSHSEARAMRLSALRVLFALLADDEAVVAPTRVLASAAGGVSPQTAADVRRRLLATGELVQSGAGILWASGGYERALEQFIAAFPRMRASLLVGRYRTRESTEKLEALLSAHLGVRRDWRWGGGAAAQRLTGYYRGNQTIVYGLDAEESWMRELPLIPDADGSVLLVAAPGPAALTSIARQCAHPLLVYADLLAEGHDRSREAAAQIHDRYLRKTR